MSTIDTKMLPAETGLEIGNGTSTGFFLLHKMKYEIGFYKVCVCTDIQAVMSVRIVIHLMYNEAGQIK